MMKAKITAITLVCSALFASPLAQADTHTLSAGYAQGKVQDFNNLRGINVKYRYDAGFLFGIITSFSYMSAEGSEFESSSWGDVTYDDNAKVKYYSLLIGPSYRINEYFSLYAVGGIGNINSKLTQNYRHTDYTYTENTTNKRTSFTYGAGIQINPVKNIAIDLGYEGSKFYETKINIFNIGIGYRF